MHKGIPWYPKRCQATALQKITSVKCHLLGISEDELHGGQRWGNILVNAAPFDIWLDGSLCLARLTNLELQQCGQGY